MRASTWLLPALLCLAACDDDSAVALAPPDAFTVTAGDRAIALSWSNDDDALVAIVRWPYPSGLEPPPGVELDVGRRFDGGGIVLYVGRDDAFIDRTVEACGAVYEYQAFTLGGRGDRSAPVTQGKAIPSVAVPGPSPAELDARVVDGGVRLAWGAPTGASDLVRIRRATSGGEPTYIYTAGGAGEHVDRDGLVPGATYFYDVLACNACGTCSEPGADVAVTVPVDFAPASLVVDPNGATVDFGWTAPRDTLVPMRLLMRLGAPVEGPDDPEATVLYEGQEPEAHVAMSTFLPDVFEDEVRYHFAVFACAGEGCSDGAAADRAFTLAEALRGGGHVVYFRHAEAGVCVDRTDLGTAEETSSPDWWKSCVRSCDVATAEQLSAEGYAAAAAAGLALRNAGVPFDEVLTSEFCRAVETADRLEVRPPSASETRPELTPFVHVTDDERCTATLELLGGAALGAPDHNAVVVGHGGLPAPECATLEDLAPGEAAIFRPSEDGPLLLARIRPDAWSDAL